MGFTPEQKAALAAPLSERNVKSRQQAGRQLSYVEAWHCIAEANRIFGFDCWSRETVELRLLGEPRMVGDKARVGYACRVRVTVWAGDSTIVREGCGFGSGIDKDVDQAHESALKEAESDAMKRALMTFGNAFGLALYDKDQANVEPERPAIPGHLQAATNAINACETPEALAQWHEAHKDMIERWNDADKATVRMTYGARLRSVKRAA